MSMLLRQWDEKTHMRGDPLAKLLTRAMWIRMRL